MAAIIKEVLTNEASVLVDSDAANKSAEADAALQDLGADVAGYAYVTTTITVLGDSPRDADLRLQAIEKIVRGRDFACIAEGLNALEAWLGSLPGNPYANVRQPPISTINLAHIMPVSAVWAGQDRDTHFNAPALFQARTQGATPFRFALHVGDVGHSLGGRADRLGQERSARLHGAPVPPLQPKRNCSRSIMAARSTRRRSALAANGTISAARSAAMPRR